jgi:hypothetical protein
MLRLFAGLVCGLSHHVGDELCQLFAGGNKAEHDAIVVTLLVLVTGAPGVVCLGVKLGE